MRKLEPETIVEAVRALCIEANTRLPADIQGALEGAAQKEPWPPAREVLGDMLRNVGEAGETGLPICQDTGMACVFVAWGQQVLLTRGTLQQAVDEGVRQGYEQGFLRKSIVADPLRRGNTGDNTPAQLTVQLTEGEGVEITVMPKGFGSENMSRVAMLKPADGKQGVENFVLETVRDAGANPCPPILVGVGVGGSFERVAALAKESLLRPLDEPHPDPYYAEMERDLLVRINRVGTGPAGYGGQTTALGVRILAAPTHIAGLPVAVNISCHVTRRARAQL